MILAWKTEKLTRAYAAMKKLDSRPETMFKSPIRIQMRLIANTKIYPRIGSLFGPQPTLKVSMNGYNLSLAKACRTLGAPSKLVMAEERVAAKHPAINRPHAKKVGTAFV